MKIKPSDIIILKNEILFRNDDINNFLRTTPFTLVTKVIYEDEDPIRTVTNTFDKISDLDWKNIYPKLNGDGSWPPPKITRDYQIDFDNKETEIQFKMMF